MKYQIKVLRQLFFKKYFKFLMLLLFYFICMITVVCINPGDITTDVFNSLVGVLNLHVFSPLDFLWNILQISITIYLSYHFFSYEWENSIEFHILRKNYLIILFHKLILIFTGNIIGKAFIYMTSFLIFKEYIKFSWYTLLLCISVHLIVSLMTFIIYIIRRKNR